MAALTRAAPGYGTEVSVGQRASVITANETNQLKTGSGKVAHVVVWNVGSAWVIDLYDDGSLDQNKVWSWATADGKGTFVLQVPMQAGIRVVTSGTTAGACTVVWS